MVLETFYRAGGLAFVRPLVQDELIPINGARQATELERTPGVGAVVQSLTGRPLSEVLGVGYGLPLHRIQVRHLDRMTRLAKRRDRDVRAPFAPDLTDERAVARLDLDVAAGRDGDGERPAGDGADVGGRDGRGRAHEGEGHDRDDGEDPGPHGTPPSSEVRGPVFRFFSTLRMGTPSVKQPATLVG